MKIAIVGSGISGLAVAYALRGRAQLTLFEAGDYFGGHTHTVDVTLPSPEGERTHGVDTGFLVFNERTYPRLIALLAELGVPTARTDMSFSAQIPATAQAPALEWNGASLDTVFAQRSNLFRPRFWGMLAEVLRFNRLATALAQRDQDDALLQPLAEFLTAHRFGAAFRDAYLLPMLGCIWSCPTDQMLHFPVATMIRFCHNHGLIQIHHRPQWWTVAGGARQYVEKIVAHVPDRRLRSPVLAIEREALGVRVTSERAGQTHVERFDRVVLACHSDQALALLRDASAAERQVLGAIRYRPNRAVLHTDAGHMPQRRRAWAAWNYERGAAPSAGSAPVCLHYWLNRLQPLPFVQPVLVSLNPIRPIAPQCVLGEFSYEHPVFDLAAIRAQAQVAALQGQNNTYFCGAWMGYGFHEDGLKAGLDVARRLQAQVDGASAT
ncbi:MAG: FAD-dependent oxidoreductase [Rhodoferax sp.]